MDNAKVAKFWEWIAQNASRLARFDIDQARVANEIGDELRRLHQPEGYDGRGPSLGFDFGPKREGVRELVISADAIPSAFYLARQLVAAAPAVPGWKFTALIPRRSIDQVLAQCQMGSDDVWFKAERDGKRINVSLYVRNIRPSYEQDISEVRTFLIYVLGEEAFGTKIGTFDCQALPSDPAKWGLRPLSDLPGFVDQDVKAERVSGAA